MAIYYSAHFPAQFQALSHTEPAASARRSPACLLRAPKLPRDVRNESPIGIQWRPPLATCNHCSLSRMLPFSIATNLPSFFFVLGHQLSQQVTVKVQTSTPVRPPTESALREEHSERELLPSLPYYCLLLLHFDTYF